MTFILPTCPDCGKYYKIWSSHEKKCDKSIKIKNEQRALRNKETMEYLKEHTEFDGRKNCWWAKQK